MDIQKQVEYFKGLPYETKREKITEMLRILQGTHETFAMFYKTVTTSNNLSETILTYLYQAILEIAEEINSGRKEGAQDKIKKMAEVLMMIRNQEEVERQREGNPEELLKSM